MTRVLRYELERLLRSPFPWLLLAAAAAVLAWSHLASLEAVLAVQEQRAELPAGVTRLLVLPLMARVALLLAAVGVILAPRWWSLDRVREQLALLRAAPVSSASLTLGKWLAAMLLGWALIVLGLCLCLPLEFFTDLDLGAVASATLALMLLAALVAAVSLCSSMLLSSPLASAVLCAVALLALWAPDSAALARGDTDSPLGLVSITRRLQPLLTGELALASLGFFALTTAVLLALAWSLGARRSPWLRGLVTMAAAGGAVAAQLGLERLDARWDWTLDGRHSLSAATVEVIEALPAPLEVLIPDERGVPLRALEAFFERVRPHHPQLRVTRVSPAAEPERYLRLGMRRDEVLLRVGEREARLRNVAETDFAGALARLSAGAEGRVAYLWGGGERDLRGAGNGDWGEFGQALVRRSLDPVPLDLVLTPVIPDDLDLLVLASGPAPPLPGLPERVGEHLARGGNLWWTLDPGDADAWSPVLAELGLERLPGVVVDARAGERGIEDPRQLLLARHPAHPALADFAQPVLLPGAAAWRQAEALDWRVRPLLVTGEASWNEVGFAAGALAPDRPDESPGPLMVALTLERERAAGSQRVVVLGDGDFLANRFVGNGGNIDLGLRALDWLLASDWLAALPARLRSDRHLALAPAGVVGFGFGGLLLLPGLLAAPGVARWVKLARA